MRFLCRFMLPGLALIFAATALANERGESHGAQAAQKSGNTLVLKMDRALPDWPHSSTTPMTHDNLADEETALNHKIDSLEQQLSGLQQRYATLSQASPQTVTRTTVPQPEAPLPWPYLAAGLLLLGGGSVWTLQRRKIKRSLESIHDDNSLAAAPQENPAGPPSQFITSDIRSKLSEEVEICLTHGNTELAINLLENAIEHEPTASAVPWLQLFDLLQRKGLINQYEKVRQKSRRYLNLYIPPFGGIAPATGKSGIESYPHVLAELVRVWPGEKALPYLNDLLHNTRAGLRAGFDAPTYNEIVLLHAIRAELASQP